MPRSAEASWPVMSYEMVVGADSDDCSKVTVPPTLESPRRTATVFVVLAVCVCVRVCVCVGVMKVIG